MSSYARGLHALAECQRCGFRFRYVNLVSDGHIPGLRVCTTCYEPQHPQEDPPQIAPDRIALRYGFPELSVPENEGQEAPPLFEEEEVIVDDTFDAWGRAWGG